jgi:hypothetical protein
MAAEQMFALATKRWPLSSAPEWMRPMLEVRMTTGGAGSASSARHYLGQVMLR